MLNRLVATMAVSSGLTSLVAGVMFMANTNTGDARVAAPVFLLVCCICVAALLVRSRQGETI